MQTVSFCELQYDTHTVSPFGYLISILQTFPQEDYYIGYGLRSVIDFKDAVKI